MKKTFILFLLFLLNCNVSAQEAEEPIYNFVIVDVQPLCGDAKNFTETNKNIQAYLTQKLEAEPQSAKGRVYVNIVIGKDGTLSDIRVVRGINEKVDATIAEWTKEMPKWTPGLLNGEPVATTYTFPVLVQ